MSLAQDLIPLAVPQSQLPFDSGHWQAVCSGRHVAQVFSTSVRWQSAKASTGRHVRLRRGGTFRRKVLVDKLWRDFFSNPSQWWDCRSEKVSPRYPDFKHKKTQNALWVVDDSNPPWVEPELAALAPGTLQIDIFSWNIKLRRYVKAGNYEKTMELFGQLQQEGIDPDEFTFPPILNACAHLGAFEEGRRIHSQIMQNGYDSDLYVTTCLVDMYAKCGHIEEAQIVFNKMASHDVVSWTAMILGYVKCGQGQKALELYRQMRVEGVEPSPVTFVGVLNACASVGALEDGKIVHEQITWKDHESEVFVGNSLIDMYAKCGSIENARSVFDKMPSRDVVSWNTLILGYVKCGEGQKALVLSRQMCTESVEPNRTTFILLVNACASISAFEEGRLVHGHIRRRGYETDDFVGSSLIDMYAKCGSIADAQIVFKKMPSRDVVSWNAMILGYLKCGEGRKALELSREMCAEGVEPDVTTFVGVLNACSSVPALEEGRHCHEQISQRGYESDVYVGSSLIDMYAKCGSIEDARIVFDKIPTRDVVCWNAMLAAYAMHGRGEEALKHFERMCQEDIEVDGVTFVSLLSACSHGGLALEGLYYFKSMTEVYNISPTIEHYACVVDVLGRAGHLHKAEDLIRSMPYEPDAAVWMSLLGACRIHDNLEMGERIAKRILQLQPENISGHVLLSNIYSAAGRMGSAPTVVAKGV